MPLGMEMLSVFDSGVTKSSGVFWIHHIAFVKRKKKKRKINQLKKNY